MKNRPSVTAKNMARAIIADAECKNLLRHVPIENVQNACETLLSEWQILALMNAVRTPSDEPPREGYPTRKELQPEREPVPDPAETESTTATKKSIPDYTNYTDYLDQLDEAGKTVWDTSLSRQSRIDAIKVCTASVDGITALLKQF